MSLARLSLVGLLGLAACGGSNSSSLGATAATLDNSAIGTFGTLVALSARMGAGARFGPFLNLVSPSVLQQTGCLSGNATFTLSATGAAGAGPVTGNANYASFDNCYFLPLNGTATVTGTLAGSAHVDSFTLEFANFAYSPTGSSQVFRASGKMVISWKPSVQGSAGYLMTLDAAVSDENQKPVFRLDGFRIDSDLAAGIENMLVAGRLTTDRGFVDVSSTNRLELSVPSHGFGSGSLDITGASQVATLTYIGEGTFTAQIRPKT